MAGPACRANALTFIRMDLRSHVHVQVGHRNTRSSRMISHLFRSSFLVIGALLFVSACAGSRETTGPSEPGDELPTPRVQLSDYEDFDAAAYREPAPRMSNEIEHDVPEDLMLGRADSGVRTTVQGFRVQVFTTLDKNVAVEQEESAKAWWNENSDNAPSGLFSGELPVSTVYMQPYYRVRIGNFTSRESAERAREFLARRFPEAFIVPDTISVTR